MEPYNEFLKTAKDLFEKCSSHYDKSKTLQKSIEENAEKYKACNEECKTLKTSLDTVKTENTTLKKTCKDLKAALDAATKEKNSLNEECKKLNLSLKAATEKNSKLEKECAASELSYSEAVNENANLKNSLNETKNANAELNKKCNELSSSLNKSKAELKDTKEKLKLSYKTIKTMGKERDAAKENFTKQISEMMGTVFKPSTISSTVAEVFVSSDDEDLSRVVSSSQCDDRGNILSKPESVKKVIGDLEVVSQSSSVKEVNHHLSPAAAKNIHGKNINVSPRRSNVIIPSATSPIPSSPSKTRIPSAEKEGIRLSPSSVAEIPNNRTTGAVSPILARRDRQDFERSSSTSIPTPENKSKITFSPTTGKQESLSSPSSPAANLPTKSNRTVTFSPTSPRRNTQSPIPFASAIIGTEDQSKIKPASPNSKDNEKSNSPSPAPILSASKKPTLTTPAASLRKDDTGNKGSSISPAITLNNQSRAKPILPQDNERTTRSSPVLTSPKDNERTTVTTRSSPVLTSPNDNERTTRSSPIIFGSSNQNRPLQGILVTSPKKDNRDSPTSALPASENQSKAKSVTIEEKGSGTSPALVVNTQNNPGITPLSLRSPLSSGNKEQNKTSTADSQNNQNITASALRGNVSTNSLLTSDRSSRSSLLLTRAQDLGNQLERSLRGHNERKDSTGLKSDSITKSSPPIENKAPVHNKEPNPEDLLSLHFPNLRRSPTQTSVCNEDSNSGIMSVLDSEAEDENNTLPSSSVESVPKDPPNSRSVDLMKFPVVYIPRIDEVTADERNKEIKSQAPRQSRKSKRTSMVSAAGPSKRPRSKSSPRENVQLSKNSQRVIKPKTYEQFI